MSYAELILPEFDQEMANARSVLEVVPDDRFDWRVGPSFNTIGWNANHLAEIPGWVEGTFAATEWDIAPVDGERYRSPNFSSTAEILGLFDHNVASARAAISSVREEQLGEMWSLLDGGQTLMAMPRRVVVRSFVINHLIHHRAILGIYLRLNSITVPGMYGPTGDAAA